jgi:hypothetical protein
MAIEFSRYRSEHREEILVLQRLLWGRHQELNSEYLNWKHETNPFLEGPLIYLALSEGRVVGMRGFMGAAWEGGDGSSPLVIPTAGDLVVEPDHRSGTVVRRMMEFALKDLWDRGYRFLTNMSGGRYTQLSSVRRGWKLVLSCGAARWTNTSFRERRFLGAPKRLLEVKLAERTGHPFGVLDRRASRLRAPSLSVETAPRPSKMASLVRRIPWDGRIRQRRDERFLEWRFRNPRSSYRFFFHGGKELDGYLVLEGRTRGTAMEARVVDWEATDAQVAKELLETAVRATGLKHLTTWLHTLEPDRKTMIQAAGFREVPEGDWDERSAPPAVLVRALGAKKTSGEENLFGRPIGEPSSWDLRPIYSDAG